ncbi:MAG: O-antigen ligase family protein [Alphaproteobacteria bacterium]|nr:O-antigen ligase family protein [Alphaproteobacteria bacterium]
MISALKNTSLVSSLLWLAAFLSSLYIVNDWQLGFFCAAILLIFAWGSYLLYSTPQISWHLPNSWVIYLIAALWLLVFLSTLHSDIFYISFLAFCFFSAMPLSFLIFTLHDKSDFSFIIKALSIVFTALALWALIQFFFLEELFEGRARHPLANPNSLAALFSLGFFGALGWFLYALQTVQNKKISALIFGLVLLIFAGLIATGSRGALLALLPCAALFMIVMHSIIRQNWKWLLALLIGCGLIFALSTYGPVERDTMIERVISTTSFEETNQLSSNRLMLWQATWEIIKTHGILGTGIGTYFLYFPEFRLDDDRWGAYYAHNDPIQFWVELGILGPFLFYAIGLAIITRTVAAMHKASDTRQKIKILTPFCALLAFGLHTHVTFNFYNLSLLFLAGFLTAYWFRTTQDVLQTPLKTLTFPPAKTVQRSLLLIPFLVTAAIFLSYILSEHHTNKARDMLMTGQLESFADHVLMANKLSFQGNYRPYILAVTVPLTLLENPEKLKGLEHQKQIFDQAHIYLKHVQDINPRSASAHYYTGRLVELAPAGLDITDISNARKSYQNALKLDPLHIGARLALADIYLQDNQESKAIELLKQGIHYKYGISTAQDLYTKLLGLYVKTGNQTGQMEMIRRMRGFQERIIRDRQKEHFPLYPHLFMH